MRRRHAGQRRCRRLPTAAYIARRDGRSSTSGDAHPPAHGRPIGSPCVDGPPVDGQVNAPFVLIGGSSSRLPASASFESVRATIRYIRLSAHGRRGSFGRGLRPLFQQAGRQVVAVAHQHRAGIELGEPYGHEWSVTGQTRGAEARGRDFVGRARGHFDSRLQ